MTAMTSRKTLTYTLSAVLVAGMASTASADERLTIGTASAGGVFFPLGTGIAEVLNRHVDGASFTAESTGGSAENVRLVGTGGTDLGLAMADVTFYAKTGTDAFEDEGAYDELAGVMMIYTQMMHVVVPADSDIETMADLAGRNISPGPAGSGTAFMGEVLLDVYGLTDEVTLDRLTHDQQSTALGDGRVDAAFFLFPPGGAAVESYAAAHNARFIPIDEEDILADIQEQYPFYAPAPIPAGTYTGQDEDVPTIGVSVAFVVNQNTPEDIVYEVTRVLNEHADELAEYHAIAEAITFESALDGMPIDLHPGAERYFRENNHPALSD